MLSWVCKGPDSKRVETPVFANIFSAVRSVPLAVVTPFFLAYASISAFDIGVSPSLVTMGREKGKGSTSLLTGCVSTVVISGDYSIPIAFSKNRDILSMILWNYVGVDTARRRLPISWYIEEGL